MTCQEFDRARLQGITARQRGKPWGANPYRGHTDKVRRMHETWHAGWQDEDRQRTRK